MNYLILSLIANIVLLFCLLSPNIVYIIHKRFFQWREKLSDLKGKVSKTTSAEVETQIAELRDWDRELPKRFVNNKNNKLVPVNNKIRQDISERLKKENYTFIEENGRMSWGLIGREIVNAFFENEDSYTHRSGEGLYMEYFKTFGRKLSLKDVEMLCQTDNDDTEKDDDGFVEWLIGDSYCSGGNLADYNKKIKKEQLLKYLKPKK